MIDEHNTKNQLFPYDVKAYSIPDYLHPMDVWQSNEMLAFEMSKHNGHLMVKESISTSPATDKEWNARLLQAQSIALAKEHGLKAQRNQLQLQLELGAMREALLESRLWYICIAYPLVGFIHNTWHSVGSLEREDSLRKKINKKKNHFFRNFPFSYITQWRLCCPKFVFLLPVVQNEFFPEPPPHRTKRHPLMS